MALISMFTSDSVSSPALIPLLCITLFLTYYILPFLFTNTSLRSIPGPFLAKFSNLWLLLQSRRGKRFLAVDAAHKTHGRVVRIQPDHVSVADEKAISIIYGHGNGFLRR